MRVQQNTKQANAGVSVDERKEESEQIVLRNTVNNQFVANKNFINQSGVWIDSDFSETPKLTEISIKFASDEYFRLVTNEPLLAPYLSLGDQVVVVWKGRVYRITK